MESVYHGYICILLYMTLMWCSGVAQIYDQLEEVGGVSMSLIYVHSAIYETYAVKWCCIDLWLIRGGRWGQSGMGLSAFFYM